MGLIAAPSIANLIERGIKLNNLMNKRDSENLIRFKKSINSLSNAMMVACFGMLGIPLFYLVLELIKHYYHIFLLINILLSWLPVCTTAWWTSVHLKWWWLINLILNTKKEIRIARWMTYVKASANCAITWITSQKK